MSGDILLVVWTSLDAPGIEWGGGGGGVLLHTLQCQAWGFKGLTVAPMGRMGSMGQGLESGVSGVSAKILAVMTGPSGDSGRQLGPGSFQSTAVRVCR